jgi:hypothetical protein
LSVDIDSSRLPVVLVTFPEAFSHDEYVALFERYAELCRQHDRIAWVIDFQRFDPVRAPQDLRRAAADVFATYKSQLIRSTVCEARVVQNTASRGILTAFDWLTGKKWPTQNFATRAAAECWAAERLELDRM